MLKSNSLKQQHRSIIVRANNDVSILNNLPKRQLNLPQSRQSSFAIATFSAQMEMQTKIITKLTSNEHDRATYGAANLVTFSQTSQSKDVLPSMNDTTKTLLPCSNNAKKNKIYIYIDTNYSLS